ncbi:DUF4349 domain-containing protein [uncultured Fibrella sp.]|uniref:DUF4349 domain-containing protein n=1 Tax=uncultured Fibrella sp. TaxID=1284596 RepID=UPI0035CB7F5D
MKTINKHVWLALAMLWLIGCQSHQDAKLMEVQVDTTLADNVPAPSGDEVSTQEAPATLVGAPADKAKLPPHQFIRTADVKFRVENVAQATHQIEAVITQQGGFVTYTKLDSQKDDTQTVAISADSLLETTRYTVSNTMTLRVPNASLDTTLRALTGLSDYLDFREIKSDDVALQRLTAAQTRQRNRAYDRRMHEAMNRREQKLGDTNDTEENRLTHQQQTDEAQVSDLALVDQLQFSTVTLTIYQRQSVQRTVLPNSNDVQAYQLGFLSRATDALATGASLLESFLLVLIEGWGIILFCLVAYMLCRYALGRFRRPLAGMKSTG